MSSYQHLRLARDERGVVTVTIDSVGRQFNVFDEDLLRELAAGVKELHQDRAARLIVFRSGKSSGFFAGADVHFMRKLATPDDAKAMLATGQQLFGEVEKLSVPTVAVIQGLCLGGGLEFVLSCTYRVARSDAATRIGAPETQIGLIPGWGGTQRLPKVVGLPEAIRMILDAGRLTAAEARDVGLVDAVLSPAAFEDELASFVNECLDDRQPRRDSQVPAEKLDAQLLVLQESRRQIAGKAQHYPALAASLDVIEVGLRDGMEAGLAAEREEFGRVLFAPASRNLFELFHWKEQARKRSTWVADDVAKGPPIKVVAVLGAGTMGAGIAQTAAAQGCSVWLMDVNGDVLQQGLSRIESVTTQAVRRQLMSPADGERVMASITPTTQISAIANADLVIEAVVERMDVKLKVFTELDRILPAATLLVSNTSALSISTLAAATGRRDRIAGLHFFNPVHRMPLVEIVRCPGTSDRTIAALVDLARQWGKTPIVVAEGPGFVANRVLYPYLDEAVRLLEEGVPAELIDSDARLFGLPMGPIELIDLIGLDVTADIGKTMDPLSREESPTTRRLIELISQGRRGKKTGAGFYTDKDARRSGQPPDATAAPDGEKLPKPRELAGEMVSGIQQRLALSMINAAADCVQERIVAEPWMADLVMVLGIGFPQFRGGPMTLADQWGCERVVELLNELTSLCGPRFRPSEYFG